MPRYAREQAYLVAFLVQRIQLRDGVVKRCFGKLARLLTLALHLIKENLQNQKRNSKTLLCGATTRAAAPNN